MSDDNVVSLAEYRAKRAAQLATEKATADAEEANPLQTRFYAAIDLAMAGDEEGAFEGFRIGFECALAAQKQGEGKQ